MPYTTENGVRIYHDHDTPPEFASGVDEELSAFNQARDEAFAKVEQLALLLDRLSGEPMGNQARAMRRLVEKIDGALGDVRWIIGGL